MAYTIEDQDALSVLLHECSGAIRMFSVTRSTLGGEHRASLLVLGTRDPRCGWINGIMENSHYARFRIADGKIELFAKHHLMPKFRKCKIKSIEHAADKIISYFALAGQ